MNASNVLSLVFISCGTASHRCRYGVKDAQRSH